MTSAGRVRFSSVETVVFGEPSTTAVPAQLDEWGVQRVLILASSSLYRQSDEVQKLAASLGDRTVEVVDGIAEHTPMDAVLDVTERARNADIQVLITIGGGTLTDAAKAVRMCLANDVRTRDDLTGRGQPGGAAPATPIVRQLSIPTTLSAAEFTGIAGVTDEVTHTKALWRQADIAPDCVVLDPWLTVHTPEWLFLSTGMRAVDHAVEGFCAASANAYTDAQTARGLRLLHDGLCAVRTDVSDIDARLLCQLGAWMAMSGLATGVPMGASHGIGYVLGAAHGVPHGYTSCVMLPPVLTWNSAVNSDRQARLVQESGIGPGTLPVLIRNMVEDLDLPSTLPALNIGPENDADIAERSMATPWLPFNPRPISGPAEVSEILALAREG